MSDISIPGVSSRFNTQKLVEDLMKIERIPLERMEERRDTFITQKQGWQEFNRTMSQLRDSSRRLYGHENPFNDRIANSSNASVVTATASRGATEETRNIRIRQVATADRFVSSPVPRDFRVADGTYGFSVGDRDVSIRFRGGTLRSFAQTITTRSGGLLRASVIDDTANTQVILIESTRTGSSNRLNFDETSAQLAEELGILRRNLAGTRDIQPQELNISNPRGEIETLADGIKANPQSSARLPFSPAVRKESGFYIEFDLHITTIPEEQWTAPAPPSGPAHPQTGSVSLEDITISNEPSRPAMPQWTAPEPPARIDDANMLSFMINGRRVPIDTVSEGRQSIRIPLDSLDGDIQSLEIHNRNTHRTVTVSPIRVFNPDQRGDYSPVNPLDNAADAIVEIDGIPVTRESNDIDDIIQGVTLHLHDSSSDRIRMDIEPDREKVKDFIIEFVANYNQLITEINILTARDASVIDEITYFSEEEREKAMGRIGLFRGDSSLMQIKTRLQTQMMNPYETSLGREFMLLAQAGISTNASGFGGGFDASRMRGYLEINEQLLDETIRTRIGPLRELFGRDTTNDLTINTGAAFAVNETIYPYTRTGGILANKSSSLDGQIARSNREIDTFMRRLERTEMDLRRRYGMMEGMIESLQQQSSALDGLGNTQQQR